MVLIWIENCLARVGTKDNNLRTKNNSQMCLLGKSYYFARRHRSYHK